MRFNYPFLAIVEWFRDLDLQHKNYTLGTGLSGEQMYSVTIDGGIKCSFPFTDAFCK